MIEVKRSTELEERVAESQEALRSGDDQWFAEHTAESGEILFYGTAPGEEWRGRDAVLALTLGDAHAWMGYRLDGRPSPRSMPRPDV